MADARVHADGGALPGPDAPGLWAEAWGRVVRRPAAACALAWLGVVAFFAAYAPVIASGHPLVWVERGADGAARRTFPLLEHLSAWDIALAAGVPLAAVVIALPGRALGATRGERWQWVLAGGLQAGLTLAACGLARATLGGVTMVTAGALALVIGAGAWLVPMVAKRGARATLVAAVALGCVGACEVGSRGGLVDFDRYAQAEASGGAAGVYTLIPWSPGQGRTDWYVKPPGWRVEPGPGGGGGGGGGRVFRLGTDALGRDVLSQVLHACRLSISIGLVSTGIAVGIGVTLGALMGFFGGWVDAVLMRLVEVVMAIPVLFLLIVAVGVLPSEWRTTHALMAVIGCVSWTGAARFTRAEFLKLRGQEFVLAARAAGLPLGSVLGRHILPNAVTPVLVDASFAVAAAILVEATLSYLGLGPPDQASWGSLLAGATSTVGDFVWWLAIFPGGAIFLTVLSYNLVGEALRDAIDPRRRAPSERA